MRQINFHKHYPLIEAEGNVCVSNNGNVIVGYKVSLPPIYSLSQDNFDELHDVWHQAFKNLPEKTIIHKKDIYRKKKIDLSVDINSSYLSKCTAKYFDKRGYLSHECYLFFSYIGNKELNNTAYSNPFIKVSNKTISSLEGDVKQFTDLISDAVGFINNSMKVKCEKLNPSDYETLTNLYFNGFQEEQKTDISLNKENIQIGNQYFDVLAINNEENLPPQLENSKINNDYSSSNYKFYKGLLDSIGLGLFENHIINQIFVIDQRKKWIDHLQKKKVEFFKSRGFGVMNKVYLNKVTALLDLITEDETALLIRANVNILYWSDSEEGLKNIGSKIKSELKELDVIPYYPLAEERKNYFLNGFFSNTSNLLNTDFFVCDIKHALCFIINNTNYKADSEGIIFCDRQFNIPIKLDVWDESKKRIKARNFAIFAPTGEGKSFLANNIIRQFYDEGVRLVIIDLGGSYKKMGLLYPDDYIELRYEEGKNLGINPFYFKKDEVITTEFVENLTEFIIQLLFDGQSDKTYKVSLRKTIEYYYQKIKVDHSITNFSSFLEKEAEDLFVNLAIEKDFFDLKKTLHLLSPYVEKGIYSHLFSTEDLTSIKIEQKKIIVFDLDEAKESEEILKIMLKLIKTAIQRTVWKNRDEKGIILFDEFAKQLKFPGVLESVEFYYQAIRKQNGSVGIILQSINQLPDSNTAIAMMENTQVIYSLRNQMGYDVLAERLKLSKHNEYQLMSLRNDLTSKRKYTEIFIKRGQDANVYRLEVPPEVYAAYLTDGSENEKLMSYFKEDNNMKNAITKFCNSN